MRRIGRLQDHSLRDLTLGVGDVGFVGFSFNPVVECLNYGFEQKRKMAKNISNTLMEQIYETAQQAGATGGKISGAGGGGFMIFYCPGTTRYNVVKALQQYNGSVKQYTFTQIGLTTWTLY